MFVTSYEAASQSPPQTGAQVIPHFSPFLSYIANFRVSQSIRQGQIVHSQQVFIFAGKLLAKLLTPDIFIV